MTEQTTVVFRKWKDGSITALFPDQVADMCGHCGSYEHIGQHGAADFNHVIKKTTQAELNEYRPLLNELMERGYKNFTIQEMVFCDNCGFEYEASELAEFSNCPNCGASEENKEDSEFVFRN